MSNQSNQRIIKEIKRIGKGAEDSSRIRQVKSSKMIEILPQIFKKKLFYFNLRGFSRIFRHFPIISRIFENSQNFEIRHVLLYLVVALMTIGTRH